MATQDLQLIFALFDVDNSGTLTRDELKQFLQSPDPDGPAVSDEKLGEYLQLADTDNSGDISVDEFIAFITNNVPQGTYSLKSIFRTIDTSGDGSVEKNEFEEVKTKNSNLNSTVVEIFEKKFQQNSEAKVTYEEFVAAVNEYYNTRK